MEQQDIILECGDAQNKKKIIILQSFLNFFTACYYVDYIYRKIDSSGKQIS